MCFNKCFYKFQGNLASILISDDPKQRMSAKEIRDKIDIDSKVFVLDIDIYFLRYMLY